MRQTQLYDLLDNGEVIMTDTLPKIRDRYKTLNQSHRGKHAAFGRKKRSHSYKIEKSESKEKTKRNLVECGEIVIVH
jgi:hypothetical protein